MLHISTMDGCGGNYAFGSTGRITSREQLSKGDVVQGLMGEVISIPIAAKADRDITDTPIKKGDTFYVLHLTEQGIGRRGFAER